MENRFFVLVGLLSLRNPVGPRLWEWAVADLNLSSSAGSKKDVADKRGLARAITPVMATKATEQGIRRDVVEIVAVALVTVEPGITSADTGTPLWNFDLLPPAQVLPSERAWRFQQLANGRGKRFYHRSRWPGPMSTSI